MEIHIDFETIPPRLVLREPDDFKRFALIVRTAEHAWVPVAVLEQLATCRADDPEWRSGLSKMIDYAERHGFLDDRGIRAHIEWRP